MHDKGKASSWKHGAISHICQGHLLEREDSFRFGNFVLSMDTYWYGSTNYKLESSGCQLSEVTEVSYWEHGAIMLDPPSDPLPLLGTYTRFLSRVEFSGITFG